jgi:hypothetical protein
MTYDDFLGLVTNEFQKNRIMRYGQVWGNMLSVYRSELAHQINGTPLDPFYQTDVTEETHEFIRERW